jgi:Fe-Mn family superoxide dismutase
MQFVLPKLPYEKNALEPYISQKTMEFHYGKHHQGYVNKLNKAIEGTTFEKMKLEDIIKATANDETKKGIFNNAAQVWNHTFYWDSMTKNGGGKPSGNVLKKIEEGFGSYEKFVEEFTAKASGQFGSGWCWLILNTKTNKMEIVTTANANNILSTTNQKPLCVLDVWEHAYYLDYQNDRGAYIDTFLKNLINWEFVEKNL